MVGLVRHCQPKGTETDRLNLKLLRQGSTLRWSSHFLKNTTIVDSFLKLAYML
jgi:hypothetical protein